MLKSPYSHGVRNQRFTMDIKDYLKQTDYFHDLDDEGLTKLSRGASYKSITSKEMLFHEGFEGLFFYILISGAVRIYKSSPDGRESTIKIIRPGEFFAEAVLFGKTHYPASAIATIKSEVLFIHRDSFWTMLENHHSRHTFLSLLFEKLRYLTDQIHHLTSLDVEDRFFEFLVNTYGKHYEYKITIPKKDIAAAIGTIPETFSRLILRLTKMGILTWVKSTLIVKENFWENEFLD